MNSSIHFKTTVAYLICLDMLSKEPPWCDGSNCYECAAKFGVTIRKHHWLVLRFYVYNQLYIHQFLL